MLYDWANRPIENPTVDQLRSLASERLVHWEPVDRSYADVSRGLSPQQLDNILLAANNGDTHAQQHLSLEIEEKDFQTAHALSTRRAAVQGLKYHCEPPQGLEEDSAAKEIAEAAEEMLSAVSSVESLKPGEVSFADEETFAGAIGEMLGALLPGYSAMEIIWAPGGAGIKGFASLPIQNIIFRMSREPLIWSRSNPTGVPLAPFKFVFHRHKARSGDMARGGLIRPLGWMFCFAQLGIKDMVRFVERYGMPFLTARLDDNTWKTERGVIAQIVRNFGSDGGAVLTKAVETELLESSSTGDVYFKLLDFFGQWKTKTVLGQLASSSDSTGLSGGDAQSQVRRDLLLSDCAQLAATIRRDILRPWVLFNYGDAAPVPEFCFEADEKKDLQALSTVVLNLKNAGKTVTDDWTEKTFGVELEDPPDPPATPPPAPRTAPKTSDESDPSGLSDLSEPPKPSGRPGPSDTAALSDPAPVSSLRSLVSGAHDATGRIAGAALAEATTDKRLMAEWLSSVQEAIAEALAGLPEADPSEADLAQFKQRLADLLENIPGLFDQMDTALLEDCIARAMFAADANGRAQAAAAVAASGDLSRTAASATREASAAKPGAQS